MATLVPSEDDKPDGQSPTSIIVSLKRTVGIPGAIALLVGTMIGSGIFATPKWVLLYTGSVGMTLLLWAMCGMLALFGALCYVELGTLIPKSGGEYSYLLEVFGPLPAFLYSWAYVLFMKPSTVMLLLVFGAYVIEPIFPGCGGRKDLIPVIKLLAAAALGKEQLDSLLSHSIVLGNRKKLDQIRRSVVVSVIPLRLKVTI